MVTCELDQDVSGEVMGLKLPAWQALLLHRVLPSCGGLLVYLTLICFDLALVVEHYKHGDEGLGTFCVILMVTPALVSMIFTLASPPPGLQTELSAFTVNVQKSEVRWIVMQFVNTIFFPVATIGRYVSQIFWWVEAVCALRADDEERTKEALQEARSPSPVELYLFLQAFIHSAPFAIINMLDLMSRHTITTFDKVSVQSISIIASSLRMADTASIYRRFEREKLCGKSYPWNKNTKAGDILITNKVLSLSEKKEIEHLYEPILKRQSTITETSDKRLNSDLIQFSARNTAVNEVVYETMIDNARLNSDFIQFSPRNTVGSSTFYDQYSDLDSETSSDYMPPVSPKKDSVWSSALDSDDEYVRPVSIIDKVAPRRRDTEYTIEKVNITPPPVMPAPRPGSIAVWAEKLVENAEAIPAWLSAPPRRKYCDEVVQDEPDIPIRVERTYMRGLEPQDISAIVMHYLGWYMFFVARLTSIACFINFFPFVAIIVLFSHYQVMLLFLIVPQASTLRRTFYFFLAFIYFFCLMEFKIRFRHVRVWHVFWIIVSTTEIIIFTILWNNIDNAMDDWWRSFIVRLVFGSLMLSYACFLVYFVLLKPRETIVYFRNKSGNTQ